MGHNYFSSWFTALLMLVSQSLFAHDFEVDGIYYNYLSQEDKTVSVTYRGNDSYLYYDRYTGKVVIPASVIYAGTTYSVASIDVAAFNTCSGLTNIEIPISVTSIGSHAFCYCTELTSIEIPNSVTSIDNFAFFGCSSLTSVKIGNSVTSIGIDAFSGCVGLTNIFVDFGNSMYDCRNDCNAIIETSSNTLIVGCQNSVVPDDVTSIGSFAFRGCTGLKHIKISNSVTTIGDYAFEGCMGLIDIEIPSNVTSIGGDAFSNCIGLTNIEIPNGVESIGSHAFEGCTRLESIVVDVYNGTYDSRNNCNAIIETASNTLVVGCQNTVIPSSVTRIGDWAFQNCTKLTSIEIPDNVTSIGLGAFSNTTWYTNQPQGLVYAGKVAYKYKGTMPNKTSVVLKDGTLGIAGEAFESCKWLTSIVIPSSITSIGECAFENCTSLTSIEIPNCVTSIGDAAFYGCKNLITIASLNPTPVAIRYSSTFSNRANTILYVPKGSKAAYEAADYWKEFKEIIEIEDGTEEKYNVTIPEFAFGKVTSDKVQAAAGEVVTFTAEPNTGYYLRELNVQKHTNGEHAQAPSVRSTNVSSAETVTMTYNAATGSYTGTYTMPACDVTVAQADFVAKTKQSIVAQDVTCTLGDTELAIAATNQTQGGGALTFAVSEGNDVVRVDAENGALTILKAGTATVTVTAAEMEKYLETAVSVQVTVLNTITAQAGDVTLPYDGAAHGIKVNVSAPTTGYTVTYGTEAGHCTLATSPTQTVVGSLTVYYKVSANGYTALEGSAKVTIVKADIAAGNYDTPQSTAVTDEGIAYTGGEQALVSGGTTNEGTTYYRVNGGAWSNETPSATEPGTYAIEWYVAGDANHNDMGSTAEPAGTLTVTILDVKEVAIVQGLATFYNGASAYRIPDNAKAWTGTIDYANGCVNMREVTGGIIPAGTAVVLTSDEEKVSLVQSLSEASAIESDLHGTDTYIGGALTGVENIYVLRNGEFVWATSGTLASGKAYLVYDPNLAPNHAAAMRLWLNFDEVTSIASLEATTKKSTSYDLQGAQVVAPHPNVLYIRNGKAVLLK